MTGVQTCALPICLFELLARKEQIEQAIDKLKYEKAAMPAADYRKQLSALLVELARIQEEIEQ